MEKESIGREENGEARLLEETPVASVEETSPQEPQSADSTNPGLEADVSTESEVVSFEHEGEVTPVEQDETEDWETALREAEGRSRRRMRFWRIGALALVAFLLLESMAFLIYVGWKQSGSKIRYSRGIFAGADADAVSVNKMNSIWKILKDNYYQELSDEELWEAMIAGTASHLGSPFTQYMTQAQVQAFRESVSGKYTGIGVTVQYDAQNRQFAITGLQKNSPAREAGLLPGDVITHIDGVPVRDFQTVQDLAKLVRGEEGTTLSLTIQRPSEGGMAHTFQVERREIETESVSYRMLHLDAQKPVGYLHINEFTETLAGQCIPALKELTDQGARDIVIDLRNNPGGDAAAMWKVLDAILDAGLIARIQGRTGGKAYEEDWETEDGVEIPRETRFAILLNEHSASASEFFSGALRDRGRAVLVGTRTFGKGVATQTFGLEDGSALNVTTFEYVLPSGEHVEGKGLQPEIAAELPAQLQVLPVDQLKMEEDTVLQAACRYFQENPQ